MRKAAQIISWLALVGLLMAPIAYLAGSVTLAATKLWMLVFTIIWFVTVPFWMGRKPK